MKPYITERKIAMIRFPPAAGYLTITPDVIAFVEKAIVMAVPFPCSDLAMRA